MTSQDLHLSPRQSDRLERLEARYPATMFRLIGQDPYSRAVQVETDDVESSAFIEITATGRAREII